MTSFIKSAKVVCDVESNLDYVEIKYDKFVNGRGFRTYVDYINTKPYANWTQLKCEPKTIPYEKFLDTMFEKTVEVRKKMAQIVVENINASKQNIHNYIRITHASKILDPTFQPPYINIKSAWQREFVKKFCKTTLLELVEECNDESRLLYFFNVLVSTQV